MEIKKELEKIEKRLEKQLKELEQKTNKKFDFKIGFNESILYIDNKAIKFAFIRDIQHFIDGMIEILK